MIFSETTDMRNMMILFRDEAGCVVAQADVFIPNAVERVRIMLARATSSADLKRLVCGRDQACADSAKHNVLPNL